MHLHLHDRFVAPFITKATRPETQRLRTERSSGTYQKQGPVLPGGIRDVESQFADPDRKIGWETGWERLVDGRRNYADTLRDKKYALRQQKAYNNSMKLGSLFKKQSLLIK